MCCFLSDVCLIAGSGNKTCDSVSYQEGKRVNRVSAEKRKIAVKIQEKFRLSSQYTPEKLLEVYRESILQELSEYSHLLYNMFKNAEIGKSASILN